MSQQFSHGYALLIGVGESAYPRLSLPVTVKDTQAIYAALIDPELCGYSEEKIRVLNNKDATKNNILESLNWLQESAKADPEATIFIYFSGHGWLNTADNRYYLLQHDIKPTKIAASALSAEVFTENLRQISAERLFVVIDSCYAAGMATSKDPEEIIREMEQQATDLADEFDQFQQIAPSKGFIDQLKQGKGRVVFTSSRGEEKSWFYENKLSIYTHHFLEALQGAANQPGDTEVKVSNLMNYLSKAVPETVQKLYGKAQTPNFDMASEDFVIAKLLGGKGLPDKGWSEMQKEEQIKLLLEVTNQQATALANLSQKPFGDHFTINGGTISNISGSGRIEYTEASHQLRNLVIVSEDNPTEASNLAERFLSQLARGVAPTQDTQAELIEKLLLAEANQEVFFRRFLIERGQQIVDSLPDGAISIAFKSVIAHFNSIQS